MCRSIQWLVHFCYWTFTESRNVEPDYVVRIQSKSIHAVCFARWQQSKNWTRAALERMLYSVICSLGVCHMPPRTTLVKKLSHWWTDLAIQKIYVYIYTHTSKCTSFFFHVNLYHGIKHDCGKTCVYNSMYIIYIYITSSIQYISFSFPRTKQVYKKTRVW